MKTKRAINEETFRFSGRTRMDREIDRYIKRWMVGCLAGWMDGCCGMRVNSSSPFFYFILFQNNKKKIVYK